MLPNPDDELFALLLLGERFEGPPSYSFIIGVRAITNRKATVLPEREGRSERGFHFL
jgi:hypothetical protein